ncbi:hypothetical protein SAMN05444166_3506 [Singulisphaera sp. GP187]|uniref:STN domain-containing protein n=1 Tax=Singulisphaera sp. GP187 TaxID=1882752 RepID=UPI00092C25E0|nr:STN domain-containing protein [Singulisphaera sp. GP187]SIO28651.1 hypothetical protein SAMN05444166_3506 [Singulisphaera sp. GP187]
MATRSTVACVFALGTFWLATITPPSAAEGQKGKANHTEKAGHSQPGRNPIGKAEPDFMIWRQKAQLELEVLQAQVEAKKAEILLREAEYRAKRLAPDLVILEKLDDPISMSFGNETPLEDVLKYIKRATTGTNDNGIPIYVDPMGLQKAEKSMTSPVTLDLEGVPLKTTLRLILKQVGLTYTVKDGLLTITAKESN